MKLAGRVAIVTGSGRGIGRAVARKLTEEGASVAVADVNVGAAERAAAELDRAFALETDVTDERSVTAMVERVLERHGRIDVLVNNVGAFPSTPWEELDLATWRRTIVVNLDSVFICCRAVSPVMRAAGYGRIVNLASDTILAGTRDLAAYVAAKGGVFAFTRALATELGPYGITVNSVAPGLTATEAVLGGEHEQYLERSRTLQAVPRTGVPDDVAPLVAFLASEEAGWVTSSLVVANGGKERW
jgi:NAD(P)-dependent dehydrogenase (short-subunit alcohol dehydrogenase family)